MTDQNINFLENFLHLYQELLEHDGFGDISVHIRWVRRDRKEICLQCGREYRYLVDIPEDNREWNTFRVVQTGRSPSGYMGPERRSQKDRRDSGSQRRSRDVPRNFRLERRVMSERRSGKDRRKG